MVRIVEVQTLTGVLKCPIFKLAVLDILSKTAYCITDSGMLLKKEIYIYLNLTDSSKCAADCGHRF